MVLKPASQSRQSEKKIKANNNKPLVALVSLNVEKPQTQQ